MTGELILRFEKPEELDRVLRLLKDLGLERLIVKQDKLPAPTEQAGHAWAFGIGDLHGELDQLNIRDFAHED